MERKLNFQISFGVKSDISDDEIRNKIIEMFREMRPLGAAGFSDGKNYEYWFKSIESIKCDNVHIVMVDIDETLHSGINYICLVTKDKDKAEKYLGKKGFCRSKIETFELDKDIFNRGIKKL